MMAWETEKVGVSAYDMSRWYTQQRKQNGFWRRVNSSSVQYTFERLDFAFASFFRRCKSGGKSGYPRFQSKGRFISIQYKYSNGAKLHGDRLYVQHVGKIKITLHREINGTIKRVAVVQEPDGKWYACFIAKQLDHTPSDSTNPPVGIDVGIEKFATLSNGEQVKNPNLLKQELPGLRRRQRSLSRKKKGGSNRKKQRKKVARLHAKIRNKRKDFHYKTALDLVRRFGDIAVEALNIAGMVRNGRLSRAISDVGWSQFITILKHKAEEAGVRIHEVNPNGTSQECSGCGATVKKNLSVRIHECSCGLVLDRDENAARNILARAKLVRREPVSLNQEATLDDSRIAV
jgi:putative transposase